MRENKDFLEGASNVRDVIVSSHNIRGYRIFYAHGQKHNIVVEVIRQGRPGIDSFLLNRGRVSAPGALWNGLEIFSTFCFHMPLQPFHGRMYKLLMPAIEDRNPRLPSLTTKINGSFVRGVLDTVRRLGIY